MALGQTVQKFVGKSNKINQVVTNKGIYDADLVIEAVGVKPNTGWLEDTLELNPDHTIKTDQYQRTSQPDIFAVGDATLVTFAPTDQTTKISLATNSRRQGRFAVKNLNKPSKPTPAVSGSSALTIFNYHFASTGIKDATAKDYHKKVSSVYVEDTYRPNFIPDNQNAKVYFKLTYDPSDGRILGAQIMSTADLTANINTISLAIQQHVTVDQLAYADFFFQPNYDRPWNIMNIAAQKAQLKIKK